ncbi:MAG: hypothetical protein IPP77_10025 [Bacteroidetes bacterium]|nr:hypothetical protein [Bacteroidota bacterium]
MRWYLIALLLVIMGAGARTMFEIAYHGMGREHDFAPEADTINLILFALWFIIMMIADVVLLRKKDIPYRNLFIGFVSIGVFAPVIYKLINK